MNPSNKLHEREQGKKTCPGTILPLAHPGEADVSRPVEPYSNSVKTFPELNYSYESPTTFLKESLPPSGTEFSEASESIDLNQILSSMHFVQLDEARKGHLGGAEVIFTMAKSKQLIKSLFKTGSAFRRMSKAVMFLFPHQREGLYEYTEHIEGLFSAKHANAHSKVILYNQSVCNQVRGGQNVLLTDYQQFNSLSKAILHADGVEYRKGTC